MDGFALIITSVTGLITALFVGYIGVKSLPQIHKAVNSNYTDLKDEITKLRSENTGLRDTALAKAEASPSLVQAAGPVDVKIVADTPVPVVVTEHPATTTEVPKEGPSNV